MTATPLLLLILPALGGVAVLALRRATGLVGPVSVAFLLLTLAVAVLAAAAGEVSVPLHGWRDGTALSLQLGGFGRIMIVLVPLIAAPVAAYAASASEPHGGARLQAWLLGFVATMELLVLAGDFLTLLVAWELVGLCSWGLIGYRWETDEAPTSAAQAFLTTRFGDLGLYLAAAAAFAATGSLEFSALDGIDGLPLSIVAGGVLLAAAAKSGQLPFSPWLFSAMSGPTPASALLHSATMVAAGAYALIKLWPWLSPVDWFGPAVMGIGLATTLAGGLVALLQSDIKKALAGSTSSQYGLMFLATGAGVTAASALQLVTHAAFKSLLFLGAGAAIHSVGSGRLDRMGLGRSLHATALLVAVGALALAAVPPLGGAYSKEAVVAAVTHRSVPVGLLVLLSGALTAFYAGRLLLLSFGPGSPEAVEGPRRGELLGIATLAFLTLASGALWLPGGAEIAQDALSAGALVESVRWELTASVVSLVVVAVLLLVLWRRGTLFDLGMSPGVRERLADWLGLPYLARLLVARPALRLAKGLASFDDRVVDAGVRGAAAAGSWMSNTLALWGERGVDGAVEAIARATVAGASASRAIDDHAIDGAVEGTARVTGVAGARSRQWQTGLAHHYYVVVGAGLLALIGVVLIWR